MVLLILLSVVAVALVVAVLAVASGRVEVDPLAEAVRSTPDHGLPPAPRSDDIGAVRFDTALLGYRMEEVDTRLAELRGVLGERESELSRLRPEVPDALDPADRPVTEPRDGG